METILSHCPIQYLISVQTGVQSDQLQAGTTTEPSVFVYLKNRVSLVEYLSHYRLLCRVRECKMQYLMQSGGKGRISDTESRSLGLHMFIFYVWIRNCVVKVEILKN